MDEPGVPWVPWVPRTELLGLALLGVAAAARGVDADAEAL